MVRQKEQLKALESEVHAGQKQLRELEEQCYALKAMAQDMERMMKSAGITPEHISPTCIKTAYFIYKLSQLAILYMPC